MKLNCLDLVPRNASIDDIKAAILRAPYDDLRAVELGFLDSDACLVEFKEKPEKPVTPMIDVLTEDQAITLALKIAPSLPLFLVHMVGDTMRVAVYPNKKISGPFILGDINTVTMAVTPYSCSVEEFPSWAIDYMVLVYRAFSGLVLGDYSLEPSEKKAAYKKGKFHPRRSVSEKQEKRLVSSHVRSGFERVLKHPRYYKNGEVPEDPKLLKRVKVRGCKVNRDIKRFNAVKVV